MREDWSAALKEHLKERFNPTTAEEDDDMYDFKCDYQMMSDMELEDDEKPTPEADDVDHSTFDKYLHAQVKLPRGDEYLMGKVVKRQRDANGMLIGTADPNPILNTALYEVEFADGTTSSAVH